jgi:hypothetical protein
MAGEVKGVKDCGWIGQLGLEDGCLGLTGFFCEALVLLILLHFYIIIYY